MPDLLTYEQAARLLDPTGKLEITARSIQRHVAAGRLRKVRVGRKPAVLKSDLMRLIEPPVPDPVQVPRKLDPTKPARISQRAQRVRETKRIQAIIRANNNR